MTERRERITVRFGALEWNEYEDITVERSMLSAAGGFELESSPRRPAPAGPGSPITIAVDGKPVLIGHVESLEHSIGGKDHSLKFGGRDLTGDLEDSSVNPDQPIELHDVNLFDIVAHLLRPFRDIQAEFQGGGGPAPTATFRHTGFSDTPFGMRFPVFALEPQESVFRAIDRAAKLRGAIVFGSRKGGLIFSAPDLLNPKSDGEVFLPPELGDFPRKRAAVRLAYGVNVKAARLEMRDADRFKTYVVRGQRPGSDEEWGGVVQDVTGRATDPSVDRYRPLVLLADAGVSPAAADYIAQFEATVRSAQARRLILTVPGWTQSPPGKSGGEPWDVNLLAKVEIEPLGIKDELLIEKIVNRRSRESGTTTELSLVRADAFIPKPEVKKSNDPFAKYLSGAKAAAIVRDPTVDEEEP